MDKNMNTQQSIKKAHLLLNEIKGLIDSQTKPADAPAWELPPLPEGMEYHRNDWTQDMLPEGYRPLILGEVNVPHVDERECGGFRSGEWLPLSSVEASKSHHPHLRTTRPLPVKPDPFAAEKAAFAQGKTIQFRNGATLINGSTLLVVRSGKWLDVIGRPFWNEGQEYRVKPEPVLVQLGPDDVPPGSAIRKDQAGGWALICSAGIDGIAIVVDGPYITTFEWSDIMNYEINRQDGLGWVPCSKPKQD